MDTRRSVIGRPNLSISGIQAPLQIHVSIPLRLFDAHRATIVAVGSVVMKTKTPNSAFGIGRQVQRRIAPRTLSFPKTGGTSVSARTLSPMKPGIAFEPQVFSPSGVEDRRNHLDSTPDRSPAKRFPRPYRRVPPQPSIPHSEAHAPPASPPQP